MTSLKESLDVFLSKSLEIRGGMLSPWVFVGEGYKTAWCENVIRELEEHLDTYIKSFNEALSIKEIHRKLSETERIRRNGYIDGYRDVLKFLRGETSSASQHGQQ